MFVVKVAWRSELRVNQIVRTVRSSRQKLIRMSNKLMSLHRQDLAVRGYTVIHTPQSVFDSVLNSVIDCVLSRIKEVQGKTGLSLQMSDLLLLDNDTFTSEIGSKSQRLIPHMVASLIASWAERTLVDIFPGTRAACAIVSPYELRSMGALRGERLDVFFRVVRPGSTDVGPAHRDCDFWEAVEGTLHLPPIPKWAKSRWKLWMPLSGWNSSTSLTFIPGSHHETIPYELTTRAGRPSARVASSFITDNEARFLSPLTPSTTPQAVIFHDAIVHRAPANTLTVARLSCELTLFSSFREQVETGRRARDSEVT